MAEARRIVISIEAEDNTGDGVSSAQARVTAFERSMEKQRRKLRSLSDTKTNINIGVNDKASDPLDKIKKKSDEIGRKPHEVSVGLKDRASAALASMGSKIKSFAGRAWNVGLVLKDRVSPLLNDIGSKLKSFASKAWKITVSIADKVTAPVRRIFSGFNSALGMLGFGVGVAGGIVAPIKMFIDQQNLESQFEVLLGSADAAKARVAELTTFAGQTPFTRDEIYQASRVLEVFTQGALSTGDGLKMVGDIASGTGESFADVAMWVGRLYDSVKSGRPVGEMTSRLQEMGAIGGEARARIEALAESGRDISETWPEVTAEFARFDGLMEKLSDNFGNLTLGVKSFLMNNLFKQLGTGMANGLTPMLQAFRAWRSENAAQITEWGQNLSITVSRWTEKAADAVGSFVGKISDMMGSSDFQNSDFFGKLGIAWDTLIGNPIGEWWNSTGKESLTNLAGDLGGNLGTGLSNGILALFGVDTQSAVSEGLSVGSSFLEGFMSGFKLDQVMDTLGSFVSGPVMDFVKGPVWDTVKNFASEHPILATGAAIAGAGKVVSKVAPVFSAIKDVGSILGGSGIATLAGGVTAGATVISSIGDMKQAKQFRTEGDTAGAEAYEASGVSKIIGVSAGALIGSILGPLGAVVGAGIGGAIGSFVGGNIKKGYEEDMAAAAEETRQLAIAQEQAKYSSQELRDAIADDSINAQELAAIYEKVKAQNLQDHFGDVALSLAEVQTLAKNIVFGENIEAFNGFADATAQADQSLARMNQSASALKKMNWKVDMGMELTGATADEYKTAIDGFVDSARTYVQDKQYEVTAAINLLVEPEKSGGILEGINSFYGGLQTQIDSLDTELQAQFEIALADEVIDADEQAIIAELQQKIADITNQITAAETSAQMKALQIKFSGAALDASSFMNFQAELQTQVAAATEQYDSALTLGITSLNLQLSSEAISEDEYKTQLSELIEGYEFNIESINVSVKNVQLEMIADAYGSAIDKILPDLEGTAVDKLSAVFDKAQASGFDDWGNEDAFASFLESAFNVKIPDGAMENIDNIAERLGAMADSLPKIKAAKERIEKELSGSDPTTPPTVPEVQTPTAKETLSHGKGPINPDAPSDSNPPFSSPFTFEPAGGLNKFTDRTKKEIQDGVGGIDMTGTFEPVAASAATDLGTSFDKVETSGAIDPMITGLTEDFSSGFDNIDMTESFAGIAASIIDGMSASLSDLSVNEAFAPLAESITSGLSEAFTAGEDMSAAFEPLAASITSGLTESLTNTEDMSAMFAPLATSITAGLTTAFAGEDLSAAFAPLATSITTGLTTALGGEDLSAAFTPLATSITTGLTTALSGADMSASFAPVAQSITSGLNAAFAELDVSTSFESITSGISTALNSFSTEGFNISAAINLNAAYELSAQPDLAALLLSPFAAAIDTALTSAYTLSNQPDISGMLNSPFSASVAVTLTASYTLANQPNISAMVGAAAHADGGIMTKPHLGLVAEAGPEAIIPLSSNMRGRGIELWQKAGEMLGVNAYAEGGTPGEGTQLTADSGGDTGTSVQVTINSQPQIVMGSGGMSEGEVVAILKNHADDLCGEFAVLLQKILSNMSLKNRG